MDRSGCCVLQNCIQVLSPERDRIIREIIHHALELSESDYGNYVVQYVIGLKDFHITQEVLMALHGYLIRLTKNKFGSHVVEKFFKEGHDEFVEPIISEVFNENDDANFLEILQHPTGNFVAQSALRRTKMMHLNHGVCMGLCMYQRLVERIDANYAFLHSHIHGKRVLSLIRNNRFR
ncbi:pumilio homolog 12-like [Chenopodium quinoa]|nr:pumilio homolog 12-like [Chenopodium quinoa]